MRQDEEKAEVLSAFLVFVFADKHGFQKSYAWNKDEISGGGGLGQGI